MEKLDPNKDGASLDVTAGNIDRLRELFPEGFAEDKIDFDTLRQILGGHVDESEERYNFTWHGKSIARRIAQTPSTGTLRPCPEESVNWDATQNLFIEGDNLEVLKLLQKSYHGRVKMIYIDPPYNTGGEFIYPDKFQDNLDTYLRYTGQVSDEGLKFSSNSETSGRYHTNWLNMMYPRLRLARNLLSADGAIFVSIDENEAANLRKLGDEIFGEENFVCSFAWQKRYSPPPDTKDIGYQHENILMWRKSQAFVANLLPLTADQTARYQNPDEDPRGPWKAMDYTCRYTADERPNLYYPIINPNTGEECLPKRTRVWASSREVTEVNLLEGRIWWGTGGTNSTPAMKNFLSEIKQGMAPSSLLLHGEVGHTDESAKELRALLPEVKFTPKPTRLIRHLMAMAASPDCLILDFFAGSGTTGDAVMRANAEDGGSRRYILVQLPEPTDPSSGEFKAGYPTIADIAKERLRRIGARLDAANADEDTDVGFRVFKLDSSNVREWAADPEDIEQSLLETVDNIMPNRSEDDVLYELLLKLGLDISMPTYLHTEGGVRLNVVGQGALVACLQPCAPSSVVDEIVRLRERLQPAIMRVVFRDSSFSDDVSKTNALQALHLAGVDDVKSI